MPQTIFRSGTADAWACYIDDPSVISVHDGALHLTVRKLPEPAAVRRPEERPDAVRLRHGVDVPAVQPAVRPLRGADQEHRHHGSRTPGVLLAVARRPLQHRAVAGRRRDRHRRDLLAVPRPRRPVPALHGDTTTADRSRGSTPPGTASPSAGYYNTYTLEWTATRLEIQVNGTTCLVNTSGDPAFQKPYIVALTQLMGAGGNAYTAAAPMPATMTIDYVRVWQ